MSCRSGFAVVLVAIAAACQGGSDTAASIDSSVKGTTYETTFPQTERPLSEGGKWVHTDPLLTVCQSTGGRAFGTQAGAGGFDDSNCYLTGFGADYEVEGVVYVNPSLGGPGNREVELLLRWTDDGPQRPTAYGDTHANGYEINAQHGGSYLQLGRFKGALLKRVDGFAIPKTGDRFRARIEGQRVRVWWNDVLKIDYTDSDAGLRIATGNPGIGFYVDRGVPNTDFGFESVKITALQPMP